LAHNLVFGFFQAPIYSFSQTVMAELTPPGFDFMVRVVLKSLSRGVAYTFWLTCGDRVGGGNAVLQLVRIDESLIVDHRSECDPGDHRQDRKHLARLPFLICDKPPVDSGHLVGGRRSQG